MVNALKRKNTMAEHTSGSLLPLYLTARDREILKCVFDCRILTADDIQHLIPGSDQQILRRLQKLTGHRTRPWRDALRDFAQIG